MSESRGFKVNYSESVDEAGGLGLFIQDISCADALGTTTGFNISGIWGRPSQLVRSAESDKAVHDWVYANDFLEVISVLDDDMILCGFSVQSATIDDGDERPDAGEREIHHPEYEVYPWMGSSPVLQVPDERLLVSRALGWAVVYGEREAYGLLAVKVRELLRVMKSGIHAVALEVPLSTDIAAMRVIVRLRKADLKV